VVAKTLHQHLANLLSHFMHLITNAISGGFNSRIQAIKTDARGFPPFRQLSNPNSLSRWETQHAPSASRLSQPLKNRKNQTMLMIFDGCCHCRNMANRICSDAVRTMRTSRIVFGCLSVFFSLSPAHALGADNKSLRDFDLVKTLSLEGTLYHVQGVDLDDRHIWVTSADTGRHLGHLSMFSRATGELEKDVTVGGKERFHPGGISTEADSIWIPVAEYRPNSTSVIEQRSKQTLALLFKFDFPDHIGCLAVSPECVIGGNWGSRHFYVWDKKGHLLRELTNPEANQYQDMKFLGNYLVASGVVTSTSGSIDWLEWPSMRVIQRVSAGITSRGVLFTNEGMSIDKEFLYLLPEDGPSRLFIYRYQAPSSP
jgi:hypothetical protein